MYLVSVKQTHRQEEQ